MAKSLSTLTVADLMTTVVAEFSPNDSLLEADVGMRLGQIRHLPVTDHAHRVIGMLSSHDVLAHHKTGLSRPTMVAEVMTKDVFVVSPGTPAHEAARLLLEHRIGALPVVDAEGVLVGIISEGDFVKVAAKLLAGEDVPKKAV